MFWTMIPAKPDNNFLVVVEGSMISADINARVANPIIKRVLDPNLPLADNTTILDVNIQPETYKVDSAFTITVLVSIPIPIKIASFNVPLTPPSHPSATTKPWWRSYETESAEGVSYIPFYKPPSLKSYRMFCSSI